MMNPHIKEAYLYGAQLAQKEFNQKVAQSLGDPNYWQPEQAQEAPQPQTVEETIQLLPAGTFQGARKTINPDGTEKTLVNVSPDALLQPEALASIFQVDPNAKVEVEAGKQKGPEGAGPEGAAPPAAPPAPMA